MKDDVVRPDTGTPGAGTRDLNDMYILALVVDLGGFSAAAREMNMSKSHLSRRVSALEARLGLRLLQRSTRKLVPTEAGERYLAYCRAVAETAREADQAMLDMLAEPTGPVTLSSPIGLGQAVLPLILPGFALAYPRVSVRVVLDDDGVDLFRDRVDVALRIRAQLEEEANVVTRRFGSSELSLVAARTYLDRRGEPATPDELARHDTLSWSVGPVGTDTWQLYGRRDQAVEIEHQPRLVSGDMQLLLEAVKSGAGISLLPDPLWRRADAAHELTQVLSEWRAPAGIVYAAYASRRGMSPAVRALIDYLAAHLVPLLERGPAAAPGIAPLHALVGRGHDR